MSLLGHDCMDYRERRVIAEGDDAYVEVCALCGKVRMESFSNRPMAWFPTPNGSWPWRYAYDDPQNSPDSNRWAFLPTEVV